MVVYLQEKKMSDCIYRNGYHDRVVMTWFSVARSGPQMVLHNTRQLRTWEMRTCGAAVTGSQNYKNVFFGIFAHIQS
jgi:hypothetical protein